MIDPTPIIESNNGNSSNRDEESDDTNDTNDTISKLNDNDVILSSERKDDYYQVISYVQIEEKRLMHDLKTNQQLLPDIIKKGRCNLKIDTKSMNFFNKINPSICSFHNYVQQRRDAKQSIESAITHCCQFISYAKMKYEILKTNNDTMNLLDTICTSHPTVCHQYFEYLYQTNLQPSTITARIDSLTLLYEWMRLNSININIYNDVSV